MKYSFLGLLIGFALSGLTVSEANALDLSRDMMLHQSKYCTQHFSRQERKHGIPKHLLMGISATESGRWHKKAGMALPWPWAVNVEGKGYYYESKHDAVTAVKRFQQQGKRSIDIGCMQINLKHHPDAFTSVESGFTPSNNIAYGAKFLRGNYNEYKSWERAVGAYHSKTPSKSSKYFAIVRKNWRRILAAVSGGDQFASKYIRKIGEDSLGGANEVVAMLAEDGTNSSSSASAHNKRKAAAKKASKSSSRASSKKLRKHKAPRMKIISVSKKARDSKTEIMVIRPTGYSDESKPNPEPIVVAGVNDRTATVQRFVMGAERSNVKKISPSSGSSSAKNGPNFIFR